MAEKQIWTGTGRRKRSSAQVRMTLGKGNITVNGVPVDEYLPYQTLVMDLKQPLAATGNEEKFDIDIVCGEYETTGGEAVHIILKDCYLTGTKSIRSKDGGVAEELYTFIGRDFKTIS